MKTLIIYWTQEGNQFFETDGDKSYLQNIVVNVSDESEVAPEHWQEVCDAATSAKYPGQYPGLKEYGWRPIEIASLGSLDNYRVVECGFFL